MGGTTQGMQTFGQYSQFLRAAVADEESLQVGESLHDLANRVEQLSLGLQNAADASKSSHASQLLGPLWEELLDALRNHRILILELGTDWRACFEYSAHLSALTLFRAQVAQWAADEAMVPPKRPSAQAFELPAWRLLGAGELLLDVYEQFRRLDQQNGEGTGSLGVFSRLARKLRRLLHRLASVLHLLR